MTSQEIKSTTSAFSVGEEEQMICRICHEQSNKGLVSPCFCERSFKYVHTDCIQKWIQYKLVENISVNGYNLLNKVEIKCQICLFALPFDAKFQKEIVDCNGFKGKVKQKGTFVMGTGIILIITLISLIGIFGSDVSNKQNDENTQIRSIILLILCCLLLLGVLCYFIKTLLVRDRIFISLRKPRGNEHQKETKMTMKHHTELEPKKVEEIQKHL